MFFCFLRSSLRPRGGHRNVEVGVGVGDVSLVLEVAAVEVQPVADEAKEGEEEKKQDKVAGEVDQMCPPTRGSLDVHFQLLEVGVGRSVDAVFDHHLKLGKKIVLLEIMQGDVTPMPLEVKNIGIQFERQI